MPARLDAVSRLLAARELVIVAGRVVLVVAVVALRLVRAAAAAPVSLRLGSGVGVGDREHLAKEAEPGGEVLGGHRMHDGGEGVVDVGGKVHVELVVQDGEEDARQSVLGEPESSQMNVSNTMSFDLGGKFTLP